MRLNRFLGIVALVGVTLGSTLAGAAEGQLTEELSPSIQKLQRLRESVTDAVSLLKKHSRDKISSRQAVIDEASRRYEAVAVCINPLIDSIVRDIRNKVEIVPERYTEDIDKCKSKGLDFIDFTNKHTIRLNEASMLDALEGLGPAIDWIMKMLTNILSSDEPERNRLIQDLEKQRLPDFREIA